MKKVFVMVVILVAVVLGWMSWPEEVLPAGVKADRVVITKSTRTLTLMRASSRLKSYRVALGGNPVGPKEREGDKKTPEGLYRVIEHKGDSSYHRALRLSYPEENDIRRAKLLGVSPGSDIMIHGLMNGVGFVGRLHRWVDWTAGCIAVTDREIDEIWRAVDDGTVVEIKP